MTDALVWMVAVGGWIFGLACMLAMFASRLSARRDAARRFREFQDRERRIKRFLVARNGKWLSVRVEINSGGGMTRDMRRSAAKWASETVLAADGREGAQDPANPFERVENPSEEAPAPGVEGFAAGVRDARANGDDSAAGLKPDEVGAIDKPGVEKVEEQGGGVAVEGELRNGPGLGEAGKQQSGI